MVLRPESLRQRLKALEEAVTGLEALRRIPPAGSETSFRDTWAVERGLQVGAEIVLDVGNHILSAQFGVSAADYEDIIIQLGARGVIDAELQGRLKGLGGFRNILVHGYLRIDPARVSDYVAKAPADFTAFIAEVRDWLERTLGSD